MVLLLASTTAIAAPKKKGARAQFDRGVAAYTKGDYTTASDALGTSFSLEADVETLFAWAQSERKLGHCDKAPAPHPEPPTRNLPARQILEEKREAAAMLDAPPATPPGSGPQTTPDAPPVDSSSPSPVAPADTTRPRWKDPVGLSLLGAGALGIVVGTVFLVKGSSAQSDADSATNYDDFLTASDRADSDGRIGVIGLVAGGAFVPAGIVW